MNSNIPSNLRTLWAGPCARCPSGGQFAENTIILIWWQPYFHWVAMKQHDKIKVQLHNGDWRATIEGNASKPKWHLAGNMLKIQHKLIYPWQLEFSEILVEIRLASAQKATQMANRLRGRNNECRKKAIYSKEKTKSVWSTGGGLVVQIIHFPDTDSRTNTLDRASREA